MFEIYKQIFGNAQISYFTKMHAMGVELLHADGWTDMTKLITALLNFVNSPKHRIIVGELPIYLCLYSLKFCVQNLTISSTA